MPDSPGSAADRPAISRRRVLLGGAAVLDTRQYRSDRPRGSGASCDISARWGVVRGLMANR